MGRVGLVFCRENESVAKKADPPDPKTMMKPKSLDLWTRGAEGASDDPSDSHVICNWKSSRETAAPPDHLAVISGFLRR